MTEYFDDSRLWEKRREAFGDASALYQCRFCNDCGEVPQLKQARRYADSWQQMLRENLDLLLWGKPGSGKTFAAACIANQMLETSGMDAPTVKMTTFGTILNRLPGMTPQEKDWYLGSLCSCDFLILDDFGMERQTEYAREQVFHIIDGRYLARKPLIITTNLSLQELKDPGTIAAQRIYDRVLEMCVPVCFDGESLRKALAKEKLRRFRELTQKEE